MCFAFEGEIMKVVGSILAALFFIAVGGYAPDAKPLATQAVPADHPMLSGGMPD